MPDNLEGKTWRALTGLNYVPEDAEEETRVEPGDKITDMPENAARHERAAGNVEEWEDRKTENVRDPDDTSESDVHIVRSRKSGDNIVLKEVDE